MIVTNYEISHDVYSNRFDLTVTFSCCDAESVDKLQTILSNWNEIGNKSGLFEGFVEKNLNRLNSLCN